MTVQVFATLLNEQTGVVDGSVGVIYTTLEGGTYRIQVVNNDTQCSNFVDVVVDNSSTIPQFELNPTIVDNTACGGTGNGFLNVDVQGGNTGFVFDWYSGSSVATGTPITLGTTSNQINNLTVGDYTVVARNTSTGCETLELTLPIADNPFLPDVVIVEESADTSCGTGNGSLRAYVTLDPDAAGGGYAGRIC